MDATNDRLKTPINAIQIFQGVFKMTDKESNNKDLLLSEERLKMVLEGSDQGFWDWNIETGEVTRNERWAQMLGYSTIQEFEDNTDTWTNSIHPDDREASWASINNHLEGRTDRHKLEYRMLTKEGGYKWILDHAKIVQRDPSDRPLRMCGTHTDITERKNAENALKKSEQSLNDAQRIAHLGSWEWDITNNLTTCSDELCRIYGLEPGEIKPNLESFLSLVNEDTKKVLTDAVENALAGKAEYDTEFSITLDNGEERILSTQGIVIRDQDNKPLRMIGSTLDITERKQAEHEKEHLQRELQQSQKTEALGKLTGGIAHEYNNMLAIILGFSELLNNSLIEQPKLLKYTNEIQLAGNRAAKLTNKLLTFSRQKTPEAESLNLNELLQKQHHMLEKTLTVRIELLFNLQENLWQVWLDDGDMEDAILNMSINAMHAIENSGQLTIQTSNQHFSQMDAQSLGIKPGDYVLLSFKDTGCGINKENKEKIFDPFFTTKGEKGTGLGLSMVYGFVQNSDGVIKVHSEPGQGTQFTFYFPRYYGNSCDQELVVDNYVETFKENKTILVVDDESSLLNLTNEILSAHGFNVFCAESAKEALDVLQRETIDILISDIIMPEMDGYQLIAIVKEKYPEIKIQLASGFTDDRNMDMADTHLQKNLLRKPFCPQELLLRIRELCN